MQNALITLPSNWISLVMRCFVCYQLQRMFDEQQQQQNNHVVQMSDKKLLKDALHVCMPMPQRLGLQLLKSKLQTEDRASSHQSQKPSRDAV